MLEYVTENLDTIVTIGGAVVALLTVIANVTKTKTDDKVVNILQRILAFGKKRVAAKEKAAEDKAAQ